MKQTTPDLDECEHRIKYRFNDRELLKQALTHSSCSTTHIDSNERLEFLGDAALGLVVSNLLYENFVSLREGELSKIKATIVSRKVCKKVAVRLELDQFLFVGRGLTSVPDSLIANVMESVIGAIYLDGGFEEARLFLEENFLPEIKAFFTPKDAKAKKNSYFSDNLGVSKNEIECLVERLDDNYKAKLQTKIQRQSPLTMPEYLLLDEKGPSHCKCFKVAVKIGKTVYQAAWGASKKETEQRAAKNALYQLQGLSPPFHDGE